MKVLEVWNMLVTIKTTTCHVCHAGTLAAPFYMKVLGPRDVGHVVVMTHGGTFAAPI